jgi:hypothetical protein
VYAGLNPSVQKELTKITMISADWSNQESERGVLHEKEKGSIFADRNGTIAQLVEQRTENPCVPGSIPGGTTQTNLPKKGGFLFYIC